MLELNKLYLMDCMEGMKTFPDNYFDLAIVDPPYGIGIGEMNLGVGGGVAKHNNHIRKAWDNKIPEPHYFAELQRISSNQIIWGANHYSLPPSAGWIVWQKMDIKNDYAPFELAYTSLSKPRMFYFLWAGMWQGNMKDKEKRIHPTQKPVQLYKWILYNYAKHDMKIIDTHVGSGSSIIAFLDYGCEWIGFEIDEDYHKAASERIRIHQMQLTIF